MKCPHCQHESGAAVATCASCGFTYERDSAEMLSHLEYLLAWLDERAPMVDPQVATQLRAEAEKQAKEVRAALTVGRPPRAEKDDVFGDLALVRSALSQLDRWGAESGVAASATAYIRKDLERWTSDLTAKLGASTPISAASDAAVVDFAIEELPTWAADGKLAPADAQRFGRYLQSRRAVLAAQPPLPVGPTAMNARDSQLARERALAHAMLLRLDQWATAVRLPVAKAIILRRFINARLHELDTQLGGRAIVPVSVSDAEVKRFALDSVPLLANAAGLQPGWVASLNSFLDPPPLAAPVGAAPADAPVVSLRQPAPAPAAPPRPPFDWAKVWQRGWELVVSGALLRGLLYLGAFMIVVSAAVLVVVYWHAFPLLLQLAFAAAVPLTFYGGGFVLRTRLQSPIAGGAFTSIASLLVAIDFAAVYQLGGLAGRVDVNLYWLTSALICTAVYAVSAWRLRGEFYGYLFWLGSANALVAFTRVVQLPLEWSIAATGGLAALMLVSAAALHDVAAPWQELTRSTRRLGLLLAVISQFAVLIVSGFKAPAPLGTFAFAAVGYGVYGWRLRARFFAHAAAWSAVVAAAFALALAAVPYEWYASAGALVALLYIAAGNWLSQQTTREARHIFVQALYVAGFGVLLLAFGGSALTLSVNIWASALAFTLIVVVLAYCAAQFHEPAALLAASGLFVLPFSLALGRWLFDARVPQLGVWVLLGWMGLALAYLAVSALMRRAAGYARWLVGCALALALGAAAGLLLNYWLTIRDWIGAPTLAVLGGMLLVFAVSAWMHDIDQFPELSWWVRWLSIPSKRQAFIWPTVPLLLVALSVAWVTIGLDMRWLPAGYLALAAAFIAGGEALARRAAAYRLPAQSGALAAFLIGTLPAVAGAFSVSRSAQNQDVPALLSALATATLLSVVAARVYRSRLPLFVEPWLAQVLLTLIVFTQSAALIGQTLNIGQYALLWTGLGAAHLLVAARLDRADVRYAHGLYLGGYALCVLALVWSASDRFVNLLTLSAIIVLALWSQWRVQRGAHRSLDEFAGMVAPNAQSDDTRFERALFLFCAVYAFPFWLYQLLALLALPLAAQGLALALLALAYLPTGRIARRIAGSYALPFYSAAHVLTPVALLLALGDERMLIVSLGAAVLMYAGSAYLSRRGGWLYVANTLVPVMALLLLHLNQLLTSTWIAGALSAIAFAYLAISLWLKRTPFAKPFHAAAYPLSALTLLIAGGDTVLAMAMFSANAVLYAVGAWAYRKVLYVYPAVWLTAAAYLLALTLTPLAPAWYGVALLPLVGGSIALGKVAFHQKRIPWQWNSPEWPLDVIRRPAVPFYTFAYALSLYTLLLAGTNALVFAWTASLVAVLYFASAALFRRASWLYPALLAAHAALLALLLYLPSGLPAHYLALPFHGLTWLVALAGYVLARRLIPAQPDAAPRRPFVHYLLTPSWAQPFWLVAAADVVLWQSVAMRSAETASVVALGHALLLGVGTLLWKDRSLLYGALAFLAAAIAETLLRQGVAGTDLFAWLGAIGLGYYLLARFLEFASIMRQRTDLAFWLRPLNRSGILLTTVMMGLTLPLIVSDPTASVAGLAFAGALYVALAHERRDLRLSFLGVALLEAAWMLALVTRGITQPQWYAIPAGLYFVGIGWLERRQARASGARQSQRTATLLESFGLSVLLLTSLAQSLSADGFGYFLLLLVEAFAVIWWGAGWHLKTPFFIGIAASVLNVLAQIAVLVNVHDVNRFVVIFTAGLMLVILAVFVEQQRIRIIAKTQEWLSVLETWE